MKITKQLIKRFENADVEVRVINGTFKLATASVTYSNGHTYKVSVGRTHPLLSSLCSPSNIGSTFNEPTSRNSSLVRREIPEELAFVEDGLYSIAEISDKEATALYENIYDAYLNFSEQMGIKEGY